MRPMVSQIAHVSTVQNVKSRHVRIVAIMMKEREIEASTEIVIGTELGK